MILSITAVPARISASVDKPLKIYSFRPAVHSFSFSCRLAHDTHSPKILCKVIDTNF